jgi:phenylacetate-CoA ligase
MAVRSDRRTGLGDPKEALSDDARAAHHSRILREAVEIAWERAPFWRVKLDDAGIAPGDVTGLEDLTRIPLTRKSEMRATMAGTGTIPLEEARRIFVSPGPMFYASQRRGDPPYPRGASPLALALHAMGFREKDIVLNTFSYHLVPAGHGIEEQLTAAGCAVIPAGPHNADLQAQVLAKLPVSGYVGTPTFLSLLCDKAAESGGDPRRDWRLEVAFVTAEKLPEELRAELEDRTGATVRQIYGSADGLLPAYECWAAAGMHLHPDQILEVLDPERGLPAAPGEPGEVVATVAAVNRPLLRFANGDLVSLRDDPCPCGRTGPRIARFVGRADETTKVRGMFVYPEQLDEVIRRHPEVTRWQAIVQRSPSGTDAFSVRVEISGAEPNGLRERIAAGIRGLVRLRADVEVVPSGTIPDGAKRVEDRRS